MEDILCTMPRPCGDSDCPLQWHREHYWIYDDGTYTACDDDGNHEACAADDVPTFEEQEAAWLEYSRYVEDTGTDPLGEFLVPRKRKLRERWEFRFAPTIGGPCVTLARRRGRKTHPSMLPQHVKDYLGLVGYGSRLTGFDSSAEFSEAGLRFHVWSAHTIDHEIPRSAERLALDLKRAARRHIKRAATSCE